MTTYIVSAGTDINHKDFDCKLFSKQKDAISYYDSLDRTLEHNAYSEIRTTDNILVRQNMNGEERYTYTIIFAGFEFGSHKRTELLKQAKTWLNENEEKLLEYFDIEYYGNIERTESSELISTIHLLNSMLKKALKADQDTINNYKPL